MENTIEQKKKSPIFLIIVLILLVAVIAFGVLVYQKETKEGNYLNQEINIDASLATQPLTDAYIKGLTDFKIKADYTNTDPGYTKLINKEADLIVVTQPSKEEQQRAQAKGVELEITPVVNEGFVFFTNKKNPVDSLTLDQIRKIYTGNITNWKEVGGKDAKIIPYQRPVNSGSQTGMLSLVMKGLKMKAPTKDELVESMVGIIDIVSNYKNDENAIGYSYYYYATTMYGNENIKLFKVNGIEPSHDTIQNKSYPLITSYYIVTRKNDTNEATEKLKEAMLSKKGQKIAREAGYVELK